MSLKLPYYPELVRVFYSNLQIQGGTLISEVHGISMVIDESIFFSLTHLPSQGAPFEGTLGLSGFACRCHWCFFCEGVIISFAFLFFSSHKKNIMKCDVTIIMMLQSLFCL